VIYTYKVFYAGQTAELDARDMFDAKEKAIARFKVRRSQQHMVSTVLMAIDGVPREVSTGSL
jgi:hypothetical protein